MKKILLPLLALVILGLIALVVFLGPLMAGAVKNTVNQFGPQVADTQVSVEAVTVSPFSGESAMSGFAVANPEGFSQEKPAMAFGSTEVKLVPGSLLSDRIVVESVRITDPYFYLEQGVGKSNLQTIVEAIQSKLPERTAGEEVPPPAEGPTKTLVIKEIVVSNPRLAGNLLGFEKEIALGDLEIKGDPEDGLTPEQAIGWALNKVLLKILEEMPDALREMGVESEMLDQFQARFNAFQQAQSGESGESGDLKEQARQEAEKRLGEAIGGFLGGNSNDEE